MCFLADCNARVDSVESNFIGGYGKLSEFPNGTRLRTYVEHRELYLCNTGDETRHKWYSPCGPSARIDYVGVSTGIWRYHTSSCIVMSISLTSKFDVSLKTM